jgi:hypothetical protein
MDRMNIGIIGAGNVGGTLGKKWALAGHAVRFGVRKPQESHFDGLRESGAVGTISEAADFGEVVVLALPASAVVDFTRQYAHQLENKLIVDTTNDMSRAEMSNLALLAEKVPTARLARAFNSLGWENLVEPEIGGVQVDHFFCAQPAARAMTERLIDDVGLRPIYIGDIDLAPALDGMTRIWVTLAIRQGYGRRLAFKLLKES